MLLKISTTPTHTHTHTHTYTHIHFYLLYEWLRIYWNVDRHDEQITVESVDQ